MIRNIKRRDFTAGLAAGFGLAAWPVGADDIRGPVHESRITFRLQDAARTVEINRLALLDRTGMVGLELGYPVPDFPADGGFGSGRGGADSLFNATVAREFAGATPAGHVVLFERTLIVVLAAVIQANLIHRAVIAHERNSWRPEDRPYRVRFNLPPVAEINRMPRIGGSYFNSDVQRLLIVVRPSIVREPL